MCIWCIDGPPTWVDVELAWNSATIPDSEYIPSVLWRNYWSNACHESRNGFKGQKYLHHGLNWMDA